MGNFTNEKRLISNLIVVLEIGRVYNSYKSFKQSKENGLVGSQIED